jgi:hypothetical protein
MSHKYRRKAPLSLADRKERKRRQLIVAVIRYASEVTTAKVMDAVAEGVALRVHMKALAEGDPMPGALPYDSDYDSESFVGDDTPF